MKLDRVTGHIEVKVTELDAEGKVIREFDDTPADFARVATATLSHCISRSLTNCLRALISMSIIYYFS